MREQLQEIGIIEKIFRYPVKSMRGESIEQSKLGWHGIEGDRRYGFVKIGNKTGFPWLTMRDVPKLILYSAAFVKPENLQESPIVVMTPAGLSFDIESADLLNEINGLSNHKTYLIHLWSGIFDAMDISLITTGSIDSISNEVGKPLGIDRFRPNILIRAIDERKYPEDKWVGKTIVFGNRNNSARVNVNRKDIRCMVVNVESDSAKQDPVILKEIVSKRKNLLGVYGTTRWPGTIEVGDTVYLYD